jgi:pyruvate formate lyase activating enzyme
MWKPLSEVCSQPNSLIFDIKCLSAAKHKKFTGVGNELILQNLKRVCASFPDLPILARTPVVPGFNDTERDIREILNFLPRRDNLRYELLPYHRMGQPKYEYLCRPFDMEGQVLRCDNRKITHRDHRNLTHPGLCFLVS